MPEGDGEVVLRNLADGKDTNFLTSARFEPLNREDFSVRMKEFFDCHLQGESATN